MANSLSVNTTNKDLWAGGAEPYKASYGKLMMWFFLISDAFTFSAFLIAYGVIRFRHPGFINLYLHFNRLINGFEVPRISLYDERVILKIMEKVSSCFNQEVA